MDVCRPSQLRAGPLLRGFYFTGVRPVVVADVAVEPQAPAPGPRSRSGRHPGFRSGKLEPSRDVGFERTRAEPPGSPVGVPQSPFLRRDLAGSSRATFEFHQLDRQSRPAAFAGGGDRGGSGIRRGMDVLLAQQPVRRARSGGYRAGAAGARSRPDARSFLAATGAVGSAAAGLAEAHGVGAERRPDEYAMGTVCGPWPLSRRVSSLLRDVPANASAPDAGYLDPIHVAARVGGVAGIPPGLRRSQGLSDHYLESG